MKLVKLITVLVFSFSTLFAQVELNIETCRQMSLVHSKKIDVANLQLSKATLQLSAYKTNRLPGLSMEALAYYSPSTTDLTMDGGYLPTYTPDANGALQPNLKLNNGQPIVGADGIPVFNMYAFMPDQIFNIGLEGIGIGALTLKQPIYMGGKINTSIRMARIATELAKDNMNRNREEVIVETDKAYWQFVSVSEKAVVAKSYVTMLDRLVLKLADNYELGMISRNDLLKAQVKYNEALLMLQKAKNGVALSQMNLCRIVGLPLITSVVPADSLEVSPLSATIAEEGDVTNRSDYALLNNQTKLKKEQVKLVRSEFLPSLGVSASYAYAELPQINGERLNNASLSAICSLSVPIFHWREGYYKTESARVEFEISRKEMEGNMELMQLDIAQKQFAYQDAQKALEIVAVSISQAEENLKVCKDNYQVGMETLVNYLDAQAQWQQVWSAFVDAKADVKVSETLLLSAIGKLVN